MKVCKNKQIKPTTTKTTREKKPTTKEKNLLRDAQPPKSREKKTNENGCPSNKNC